MMNSRSSFAAFLLACSFFFVLALPALAGAKAPPPPPDMRKLVKSVDKANNAIDILYVHAHRDHIYRLDGTTTVQIDGVAATFADIKSGMEVIDYAERDNDDLDSVSLQTKTHAPVNPTAAVLNGDKEKKIESVLADKNAVVILFVQSQLVRTYHIDGSTALTVNGGAGTFAEIKPGMEVKDYTERDSDDLDSLTVTGY